MEYSPDLSQLNAFDRGRQYTVYLVKGDEFGFHLHYIATVRGPIIADFLDQAQSKVALMTSDQNVVSKVYY